MGEYANGPIPNWHEITVVADREQTNSLTLYLDGIAVDTLESSDTLMPDYAGGDLLLGALQKQDDSACAGIYHSIFDDLEIYDMPLDAGQIAQNYHEMPSTGEFGVIEKRLSLISPGDQYPQSAIDSIQASLTHAKEEQRQNSAQSEAIYNRFLTEYEQFMEGEPAKFSFYLLADAHIGNAYAWQDTIQGIKDLNTCAPDPKAVMVAGDLIQNGEDEEMCKLFVALDTYLAKA